MSMFQTTQAEKANYTGFGKFNVAFINPNPKQYEEFFGKAPEKELVYVEEVERENNGTKEKFIRWKIQFYLEGIDQKDSEIKLGKRVFTTFLHPFKITSKGLERNVRSSNKNGLVKYEFMNQHGETIWVADKKHIQEMAEGQIPREYEIHPDKVEGVVNQAKRFLKVEDPNMPTFIYPSIEGWSKFVNDILRGLFNTGTYVRKNFYFAPTPSVFDKDCSVLVNAISSKVKAEKLPVGLLTGISEKGYKDFVPYFVGNSQSLSVITKAAKNGKYYNLGEHLYGEYPTKLDWGNDFNLKLVSDIPTPNSGHSTPAALNSTGDGSANDWGSAGDVNF